MNVKTQLGIQQLEKQYIKDTLFKLWQADRRNEKKPSHWQAKWMFLLHWIVPPKEKAKEEVGEDLNSESIFRKAERQDILKLVTNRVAEAREEIRNNQIKFFKDIIPSPKWIEIIKQERQPEDSDYHFIVNRYLSAEEPLPKEMVHSEILLLKMQNSEILDFYETISATEATYFDFVADEIYKNNRQNWRESQGIPDFREAINNWFLNGYDKKYSFNLSSLNEIRTVFNNAFHVFLLCSLAYQIRLLKSTPQNIRESKSKLAEIQNLLCQNQYKIHKLKDLIKNHIPSDEKKAKQHLEECKASFFALKNMEERIRRWEKQSQEIPVKIWKRFCTPKMICDSGIFAMEMALRFDSSVYFDDEEGESALTTPPTMGAYFEFIKEKIKYDLSKVLVKSLTFFFENGKEAELRYLYGRNERTQWKEEIKKDQQEKNESKEPRLEETGKHDDEEDRDSEELYEDFEPEDSEPEVDHQKSDWRYGNYISEIDLNIPKNKRIIQRILSLKGGKTILALIMTVHLKTQKSKNRTDREDAEDILDMFLSNMKSYFQGRHEQNVYHEAILRDALLQTHYFHEIIRKVDERIMGKGSKGKKISGDQPGQDAYAELIEFLCHFPFEMWSQLWQQMIERSPALKRQRNQWPLKKFTNRQYFIIEYIIEKCKKNGKWGDVDLDIINNLQEMESEEQEHAERVAPVIPGEQKLLDRRDATAKDKLFATQLAELTKKNRPFIKLHLKIKDYFFNKKILNPKEYIYIRRLITECRKIPSKCYKELGVKQFQTVLYDKLYRRLSHQKIPLKFRILSRAHMRKIHERVLEKIGDEIHFALTEKPF